jgi:hypothetical protein
MKNENRREYLVSGSREGQRRRNKRDEKATMSLAK